MDYVFNISSDNFQQPISYLDSRNKKYPTNLVKFSDKEFTTPLEMYYVAEYDKPNLFDIPQPIINFVIINKQLETKNYFKSFYSVNTNETRLNSFYFSYDLNHTEKLSGINYDVDNNLFGFCKIFHIKIDPFAAFMCAYYSIQIEDDVKKQLMLSKMTAYSDAEKSRVETILASLKTPLNFVITRRNDDSVVIM
jgi:hypothetical protein